MRKLPLFGVQPVMSCRGMLRSIGGGGRRKGCNKRCIDVSGYVCGMWEYSSFEGQDSAFKGKIEDHYSGLKVRKRWDAETTILWSVSRWVR